MRLIHGPKMSAKKDGCLNTIFETQYREIGRCGRVGIEEECTPVVVRDKAHAFCPPDADDRKYRNVVAPRYVPVIVPYASVGDRGVMDLVGETSLSHVRFRRLLGRIGPTEENVREYESGSRESGIIYFHPTSGFVLMEDSNLLVPFAGIDDDDWSKTATRDGIMMSDRFFEVIRRSGDSIEYQDFLAYARLNLRRDVVLGNGVL
ncbi:hypothetical protein ACFLQN_00605 [Candidatus Aenigmatarchaeota archaeon]